MNKTLKNIVLGTVLAGTLSAVGCKDEKTEFRDPKLPFPMCNQRLIEHPDYTTGVAPLAFSLFTDLDGDGNWDVEERVYCGFTTGSYTKEVFIKKGYLSDANVTVVEPSFFDPYQ